MNADSPPLEAFDDLFGQLYPGVPKTDVQYSECRKMFLFGAWYAQRKIDHLRQLPKTDADNIVFSFGMDLVEHLKNTVTLT